MNLCRRSMLLLTSALVLGCNLPHAPASDLPAAVVKPPDMQVAAPGFPDAAERRALHAELLMTVRKYHVFAEPTAKNLGIKWEQTLRALEPVFAMAAEPGALREALSRFGNSLHDMHLGYDSELSGERLRLGLTLMASWRDDHAEYRVQSVEDPVLRERVQPGDWLVAVDEIPAEQLPHRYLDRSAANNWPAVAADVARYLTRRDSDVARTRAGDIEHWRLRHSDSAAPYSLELRWEKRGSVAPTSNELRTEPDYRPTRCHPYDSLDAGALPERNYNGPPTRQPGSGYRITGRGQHFCLYTSEQPPYSHYPIVRHFSFFYYAGFPRDHAEDAALNNAATYAVAADYFSLSRMLRERPQTRGLIVDLRDNGGGNDPDWFLDWYAPAPYEDVYTAVRVMPEWLDSNFTDRVLNIDEGWLAWYRGAAAARAPGSWLTRPWKCRRLDCSGGNHNTPAHALLKVPVALLVGRGCQSSCAAFASIFDEYDFGPLIGEPAQATQTTQIYTHPVRTRSGLQLGRIKLALNDTRSGKNGQLLEGVLPAVDYPVPLTIESRDAWDSALIAAALRAFKEYRFPRPIAPLGP